jgi:hypothetical protein
MSGAAAFIQGDSNLFTSVGCLGVRDKDAGEDSRLFEDCCCQERDSAGTAGIA